MYCIGNNQCAIGFQLEEVSDMSKCQKAARIRHTKLKRFPFFKSLAGQLVKFLPARSTLCLPLHSPCMGRTRPAP